MLDYDPNYLVRIQPFRGSFHVSQGRAVLYTGLDGCIAPESNQGFFISKARVLSAYRYLINGQAPQPNVLSNVEQHSWLGYYTAVPPGLGNAFADQGSGQMQAMSEYTLELRVSRYVGEGMHEDLDLTNFSRRPTSFRLELELDADFADQEELQGKRRQKGRLRRSWQRGEHGNPQLQFDYAASHFYWHQGNWGRARFAASVAVQVKNFDSPPIYRHGRIRFNVTLPPGGSWHACIEFIPTIDGQLLGADYDCRSFFRDVTRYDHLRQQFMVKSARFISSHSDSLSSVVTGSLERAKRDLASLRLYQFDRPPGWTMAAGLPLYIALFGRDTLTAAWEAALLGPEMMTGTLRELARWQGKVRNDWRDEQPGRMLHEAHENPTSKLHFNPRSRYYGSVTTSAFYPVIVSELWHWTGDKELIGPLVTPALDSLRWLDRYSDSSRHGFFKYQTRSKQGTKHQAWKDSGTAIVREDGSQVEPPIATCEEQGFVYAAKLQFAEVLWWLGRKNDARRLLREARELKKRFNDRFWMEEEGYFALALDSRGKQVRAITSNPGHCIAAGIADSDLVERAAERMFQPDLFSGWGVRTLSADNPAYNPYSYHRGSVWPVEHGSFALGLMRYGLVSQMQRLSRAMFESAALFQYYRLPEVFSGHARDDDHPFPAIYPQTNWPQAWSASALFLLVQSLLGLYPYAPLNLLLVDPQLPEWLPELTVEGLRVGEAAVTIRFFRGKDGKSDYKILDKRGRLHVVRQPSPWSQTAGVPERLKDLLMSLTPGR